MILRKEMKVELKTEIYTYAPGKSTTQWQTKCEDLTSFGTY